MKNKILALFLAAFTQHASATLIDSTVEFKHIFKDRTYATATVVAKDDNSDLADILLGSNSSGPAGYTIDINSNQIFIDFYISQGRTNFNETGTTPLGSPFPYINGLVISGLGLDAQSFVESASIFQNNFSFDESRIIKYHSSSIGLDFQSMTFNNSSTLTISYNPMISVPEPNSLFIILLGYVLLSVFVNFKLRPNKWVGRDCVPLRFSCPAP